jgi:hypothetical protein
VRYVAVTQWGTQRDFDVVLRNASSGSVVATLLNQTAVLDSQNWQVIDVSALNFTVGAQDFVVELRPASSCNGNNGFTVPYSGVSNANSKFSSVCSDLFTDFHADPRELFLRAVVENGGAPGVSVSAVTAGFPTTLSVYNLTANDQAIVGYSLAGAGPVATRFGSLALSLPIGRITVNSNSNGAASATLNLPASLAGATVWLQVIDLASGEIGAGLEVSIQ